MLIGLSMLQFLLRTPLFVAADQMPRHNDRRSQPVRPHAALTLAAQCPPVFAAAPADTDLADIVHGTRWATAGADDRLYVTLGTNTDAQSTFLTVRLVWLGGSNHSLAL